MVVKMEQIGRIKKMEQHLDEGTAAVSELRKALEQYKTALPGIKELEAYYQSELWLSDVEDDENGRLPEGLKRGVLSEDAVWDLLTEYDHLRETLREPAE